MDMETKEAGKALSIGCLAVTLVMVTIGAFIAGVGWVYDAVRGVIG